MPDISKGKNKLSNEKIHEIFCLYKSDIKITEIKELTEGFCNSAYSITDSTGKGYILKVAPLDKSSLMACEINMMRAEAKAMALVKSVIPELVPELFCYNDDTSVCGSEYIIVERLNGVSLSSVSSKVGEVQKEKNREELGKIQRRLKDNTYNDRFGYICDDEGQRSDWFSTFYIMLSGMLDNAKAKSIDMGISSEEMLGLLSDDKKIFDEIEKPSLVHFDMWEGNVFVDENTYEIIGIIDWERAIWGDPMADDRFRSHCRTESFLIGFGKENLTDSEMRRILWYDTYLYMIMINEVKYRNYADQNQYSWVKKLYSETIEKLKNKAFL